MKPDVIFLPDAKLFFEENYYTNFTDEKISSFNCSRIAGERFCCNFKASNIHSRLPTAHHLYRFSNFCPNGNVLLSITNRIILQRTFEEIVLLVCFSKVPVTLPVTSTLTIKQSCKIFF